MYVCEAITLKCRAIAHPIQGLIKYHGLKDPVLRLPYHDSISVCVEALSTMTTVEFEEGPGEDTVTINGRNVLGMDLQRVRTVLQKLVEAYGCPVHARVTSENSLTTGKGLGFSASGFAALGLAAAEALSLDLDYISLSEIVRLGAGSATRSLAGGFALWYADKNGRSYAEQIAAPGNLDLTMVIIPIWSALRTDEAHKESVTSPLFQARLGYIARMVETMKDAIASRDVPAVGQLAEEDTLNLHAITMTSHSHLVLWEPETVKVIKEVQALRSQRVPCWYSMDTGPSVFVNTSSDHAAVVADRIKSLGLPVVISRVGGKATTF